MNKEAHEPVSPTHDLRKALEGIADDYMTSEQHHPGYVLIPITKFEQLRTASEALYLSTPTGEVDEGEAPAVTGSNAHTRPGMIEASVAGGCCRSVTEEPAALAHPQQGGERDGWKLVPIEPTRDMLCAWMGYVSGASVPSASYEELLRMYYRRMMEAVPTAPPSPSKNSGETMPTASTEKPSKALADIAAERRRQIEVYGWTPEHDDTHDAGEFSAAGAAYALNAGDQLRPISQGDGGNEKPDFWPFEESWWKPGDPRRDLVKAAALIVAEIERIDRQS